MANTPQTCQAAREALETHVSHVGGTENDETTQIVDLIADLLLLLPDNETAEAVVDSAALHAVLDRSGL